MTKKILAVTKGIGWFTMCGFAEHGIGVWLREEAINKKSLPKMILGTIAAIGVVMTSGWVGKEVGGLLYDEFVEEEESEERRSR